MNWSELLMPNYGTPSVTFVKGSGTELFDKDGKRYLDFLCGIAVTGLGHSHPRIANAISEQANTLLHVSNLFITEPQLEVAATLDRLINIGSDQSGKILFQNSGAEANEAAMKLARKYQGVGKHGVLSAYKSFHGRTMATLAATGQPEKHKPFMPLPEGFKYAEWNNLASFEGAIDQTTGAVLVEPIQGEGGVNNASSDFLQGLRKLCDEKGLLLIMDEIQTGLGRTGEWFGFHHADIKPDIVTMAKGMANGVPIGAVWAKSEVADAFEPGDHGSTFAGQPLATSAARETLRVLEEIQAPKLAKEKGEEMAAAITNIDGVDSVRGLGLLLGVEIEKEGLVKGDARDLAQDCLKEGLVLNGVTPTALRLAPPLTISSEEIIEGAEILEKVLKTRKENAS
ncbi:MAG: aspartate aminotransferase family protein [Acidimicrobiales bacterium]|jgi:predicted acetylornithine/succinylornithine family transaminase|nr:aspartate aminotransferase family protein [Acidimicrobiales bacterium]